MVANLAWVLKVWHGIFITLFTRFTSICELCLQLENLKSYILRFLSSSVVVMVMFLPPMRKACIPSFERKKTAKELLTIWVKGFQFQNLSTWHGAFINRNKYSKKKFKIDKYVLEALPAFGKSLGKLFSKKLANLLIKNYFIVFVQLRKA